MRRITSIATACVAAVLLALAVTVGAQDFNTQERTYLTFSQSVELPGLTLPAGTFTFRLADTPGRNVVQVLNEDETHIHGQFLFVPAERLEVTGDTVITFRETQERMTPAVQYWYYPGEKIGKEFIYPKDQAMKIAARTGMEVRTEDGLVSADGTVHSTDARGQVTEWQRDETTSTGTDASVPGAAGVSQPADAAAPGVAAEHDRAAAQPIAPQPAAEPADRAGIAADASTRANEPVGTTGVQAEGTVARAPQGELPRTASPLALSGLLGMLSLAGALGLRRFRG